MQALKNLYVKHKQLLLYLVFGALTTAVNLVLYYPLYTWAHLTGAVSSVIAWVGAVLFAYATNKRFVFESRGLSARETLTELMRFMGARVATGVFDVALMAIAVDRLHGNGMVWKLISNIIVIILNFIASKLLVFRKKR